MDKESQHNISLPSAIKPPTESRFSTVLNGVGNGMMIGAIPLLGMKLFEHATGAVLPHKKLVTAFATVSGCAIGGFFGIAESKRMHDYRLAINEEITKIRGEVDANSKRIDQWSKKMEERTKATAAEPVART